VSLVQTKYRVLLLVGLIAAVFLIMAAPRLGLVPQSVQEFAVTPQPADAYARAEKSGKPVFLEFYAKW
jgi:thiol:disulfide interchange protein